VLAIPVVLSWRAHHRSSYELGLDLRAFYLSFARWRTLWIVSIALLVLLGWRVLFELQTLERGTLYFVWCATQQLVLQSMIYLPLLDAFQRRGARSFSSGARILRHHARNPVLVPATFAWGAVPCFLFDRLPAVWGLALLQGMVSSLLVWLTPYTLNHGFRIGPINYR
jgi:hypothetical protein